MSGGASFELLDWGQGSHLPLSHLLVRFLSFSLSLSLTPSLAACLSLRVNWWRCVSRAPWGQGIVCVHLYLIEGLCVCVFMYLYRMGASLELLDGNILSVYSCICTVWRYFVCLYRIHVSVPWGGTSLELLEGKLVCQCLCASIIVYVSVWVQTVLSICNKICAIYQTNSCLCLCVSNLRWIFSKFIFIILNWAGSKLWWMSNLYMLVRTPWSALFVSYAMLHKLTSGALYIYVLNTCVFLVICIWFCFAGASRYRGALRRLDAVHCCVINSNTQLAGRHKISLLSIFCCRVKTLCKNVQEGMYIHVCTYV